MSDVPGRPEVGPHDSHSLKMAKGLMSQTIDYYADVYDGKVQDPGLIESTYSAAEIAAKHATFFALLSIAESLEQLVRET